MATGWLRQRSCPRGRLRSPGTERLPLRVLVVRVLAVRVLAVRAPPQPQEDHAGERHGCVT